MLTRHKDLRAEQIGVLDIGSSKICCLIVERAWRPGHDEPASVQVLGVGHQRSRGIKAGYVSDMEDAEAAVCTAISQAESAAGIRLSDIVMNVTCGRMKSMHYCAHAELVAGHVRPIDLDRLSQGAYAYAERGGRAVIHMNRVEYLLDGQAGVHQPLRMAGNRLSAQYHAVTVDDTALENLLQLARRALLDVRQCIPAGLASAFAVTTEEERKYGVITVDIGEGTTDIALMADGRFMGVEVLPYGGGLLTYDIAKTLMMPLAEAERIKTLYGTMLPADSNDQQTIGYRIFNGDEAENSTTTRSELRRIIHPRMLGQLKLLRERIEASKVFRDTDYSVVLTGEASQLVGLPAVAADILGRPVRLGQPRLIEGGGSLKGPAFATIAGMIAMSGRNAEHRKSTIEASRQPGSRSWSTVRDWLIQSF